MQTKEVLKRNLEYLHLDLNNIADGLKMTQAYTFKSNRVNTDKENKVYKYINVEDIQIYLTPHNRDDDIAVRWSDAIPLSKYLLLFENNNDNENIIENIDLNEKEQGEGKEEKEQQGREEKNNRFNINIDLDYEDNNKKIEFLELFSNFNKKQIEEIEKEQIQFNKEIPFSIFYSRASMWNIYYDEKNRQYSMLVHTKEADFSEMFFLLKQKNILAEKKSGKENEWKNIEENEEEILENNINNIKLEDYIEKSDTEILIDVKEKEDENKEVVIDKIYAPINYMNLSSNFLRLR